MVYFADKTITLQVVTKVVSSGKTITTPTGDGATVSCDVQPIFGKTARKEYGISTDRAYKIYCDLSVNVDKNDIVKYEDNYYKVVVEPEKWSDYQKVVVEYDKKLN